MQENHWYQIERIFNRAVGVTVGERKAFVRCECRGEENLYSEVVSLLSADDKSDGIFEYSVIPIIGEILNKSVESLLEESDFASYKLQKLLGQGGSGAVFLAEDPRLKRSVAIKILPRISGHSATVQRFRREARAASAVVHQNVAHVYEFDVYNEIHFLAMEYVAGKTLRQTLGEKPIELKDAVEITVQIAQALRAAHKKHIYHRDIKPENIMLTEEGFVKVLDFGLAKLGRENAQGTDSEIKSVPGLILGTTAYMSPEQIRADTVDGRTDLWSLGVIFYEMLTGGVRPFQGRTASDVQAAVLLKEPPATLADKPTSLGKIIEKLLAKEVSDRYQTADELLFDLRRAQRDVYDYKKKQTLPSRVGRLLKGVIHLYLP